MSIQGAIDKVLQEANSKPRTRSGKFSPSSFGRCYRAQIWNRKNEPVTNPPDARTLRVFRAGSLFHDFVQGIVINEEASIQKEVKVETEDVLGYADLVSEATVWDIKSQHSRSFHYLAKSTNIGEDKKSNVLQVLFYARVLGRKEGRLVFVSKDDLCIAEYGFILNDKWNKELDNELEALRGYWERGELPPSEPRAYKKKDGSFAECGYCNWKDKCKGGSK